MEQRTVQIGVWVFAAAALLSGCGPSLQDLRAQYAMEKQKLGERERALLEFERFNVDLAGQQRIQKADIDKVAEAYAGPQKSHSDSEYEQDMKYVQTQRERLAAANRLVEETHAKLVEEVKEQQQRVAEAEARLQKAER